MTAPRWGDAGDARWNDDGLVWGSVVPLVTLEVRWSAVQELDERRYHVAVVAAE